MDTVRWRLPIAALVLGVSGDLLLRGGMWRLGFALWITVLVIIATILTPHLPTARRLLLAGVVAAAAGLVLRDSPLLYAIDMLSLLCTGALVIWQASGKRIADLTILETIRAALLAAINSIAGAVGTLRTTSVQRDAMERDRWPIRSLLIGLVIAVPPLFIVALLLSSSDAVFRQLLDNVLRVFATNALNHLAVILGLAWITAGWLRANCGDVIGADVGTPHTPALPFATVGIGLYLLGALLVLFVATQARVLFGGEAFLRQAAGLTAAEYARDGFFQLIAAAGVVMATLLAAEWLMNPDDSNARRQYRAAGLLLVIMVGALLVSAAARIGIYVRQFGLSIDRAFACAVIVWVFATLLTATFTTLRGRSDRFAPTTLFVTIAWVALLNVVNLEAIVVRTNVARASKGASFDAAFHARLSADALPALRASAATLSRTDCEALAAHLINTWQERVAGEPIRWQSASLPLAQARTWYAEGAKLGCRTQ